MLVPVLPLPLLQHLLRVQLQPYQLQRLRTPVNQHSVLVVPQRQLQLLQALQASQLSALEVRPPQHQLPQYQPPQHRLLQLLLQLLSLHFPLVVQQPQQLLHLLQHLRQSLHSHLVQVLQLLLAKRRKRQNLQLLREHSLLVPRRMKLSLQLVASLLEVLLHPLIRKMKLSQLQLADSPSVQRRTTQRRMMLNPPEDFPLVQRRKKRSLLLQVLLLQVLLLVVSHLVQRKMRRSQPSPDLQKLNLQTKRSHLRLQPLTVKIKHR